MLSRTSISLRKASKVAFVTGGFLFLAACQSFVSPAPGEGIGFRVERAEEITAMREYRACTREAIDLDRLARETGSSAKYLASARLIESCESNIGPGASKLAVEERMRHYSLAVLNNFRGGDLDRARGTLQTLEASFPGNDVYFQDGSSFRETMGALLGREDNTSFGRFSTLNVSRALKDEMQRVNYWAKN